MMMLPATTNVITTGVSSPSALSTAVVSAATTTDTLSTTSTNSGNHSSPGRRRGRRRKNQGMRKNNTTNNSNSGSNSSTNNNSNYQKSFPSNSSNCSSTSSISSHGNAKKHDKSSRNNSNSSNNNNRKKASRGAYSRQDSLSLLTMTTNTRDEDRKAAVEYIELVLNKWATDISEQNPWKKACVALIPFGSYRLGVHRDDSDMDLLALCPAKCTRNDFFTSFVEVLKKDDKIQGVHPIPTAYTPVIKFKIMGFEVDVLHCCVADSQKLLQYQQTHSLVKLGGSQDEKEYANVDGDVQGEYYQISDIDLVGQDSAGVRSLNGARVSQILLEMIPATRLEVFRRVLRIVKEWADRQGIYSNALGYLGGVNWAILVAWVCIQYPSTSVENTLLSFFHTFAYWRWPIPVLLNPIQEMPPQGAPYLQAWNPQKDYRDRYHIMPIITPAYPSMNSSYNVGLPQMRRIKDEMMRVSNMLRENNNKIGFSTLAEPSDFFHRYDQYMQISIQANNQSDFLEWFRFVESRVRFLIIAMETDKVHAWPYGKFFDVAYNKSGIKMGKGVSTPDCLHESLFFIGLSFEDSAQDSMIDVELRHLPSDFLHKVNNWEHRRDGMEVFISRMNANNLPDVVTSVSNVPSIPSNITMVAPKHSGLSVKNNRTSTPPRNGTVTAAKAPCSPDIVSPMKKSRTTCKA